MRCDNQRPQPLRELMQTDVVTVNGDTNIMELAEQMKPGKPKNYPVIDGVTYSPAHNYTYSYLLLLR